MPVFLPGASKRLFLLQLCGNLVTRLVLPKMFDPPFVPPLKPLHPDTLLSPAKLEEMKLRATDVLQNSLLPGGKDSLKTRPDGTILDGHHRIHVLRMRGVDVDALPREIIVKGES
jgi:hypothetical protein